MHLYGSSEDTVQNTFCYSANSILQAAFDNQLVRRGILPEALKRGRSTMNNMNGLFTSESVSPGHPDKICDQISDAVLDACLASDPEARVAVEVAIKGNLLCILGELTTDAQINVEEIARQVLCDIGHADGSWGVNPAGIRIIQELSQQSPEIGARVGSEDTGAGDQGLMFGYATHETAEYMPLPFMISRSLIDRLEVLRASGFSHLLGPDAKAQATLRYTDGKPTALTAIVLSCQHSENLQLSELRDMLRAEILVPVLGKWLDADTRIHLNPAGSFHMGGPVADAGLTGRKIIADTYGGISRHGGGAFSGKDATKVDRSAAYAARQIARDVVARGWADLCEVRVAYAIGESRPVAVDFDTFGTAKGSVPAERYLKLGVDVADALRPAAIVDRLNLRRPVFRQTAARGHFGRPGYQWEDPFLTDQPLTREPVRNSL